MPPMGQAVTLTTLPPFTQMSISVDDLTSSLSASHIGQEAIELAALQAQLAQTLFGQSMSQQSSERPATRKPSLTQPCNTPTMSSSFSWAHMAELHRQFAVSQNIDASVLDNGDEVGEDERMVEDLLVPSSPLSATSQLVLPSSSSVTIPQFTSHTTPESSSSSFTSTDPFYIAQSEAMRNCSIHSYSVSQFGLPQQSPFVVQEPFPRQELHSAPPSLPGYPYTFCDNIGYFPPLGRMAGR